MRMTIILTMVCLLVSGCVSAKYNPKTGLISYDRMGNMDAADVEITLPDGVSVKVGSVKNTGFNQLMEMLSESYKAGVVAGASGVAP